VNRNKVSAYMSAVAAAARGRGVARGRPRRQDPAEADGIMSDTPPRGQSLGAQDLDVLKYRIKSAAMQVLGDLGVEW
jgi:hypothetical protein